MPAARADVERAIADGAHDAMEFAGTAVRVVSVEGNRVRAPELALCPVCQGDVCVACVIVVFAILPMCLAVDVMCESCMLINLQATLEMLGPTGRPCMAMGALLPARASVILVELSAKAPSAGHRPREHSFDDTMHLSPAGRAHAMVTTAGGGGSGERVRSCMRLSAICAS
jgi:hypothetical protein